jgi:hypothetical protein
MTREPAPLFPAERAQGERERSERVGPTEKREGREIKKIRKSIMTNSHLKKRDENSIKF